MRSAVRWDATTIALLGTTLGLVIGTGFGWAIVTALEGEGISEFHVPIASLGVITLISALAGAAAAILPDGHAARLDVLGAITSRMITRSSRPPAPHFGGGAGERLGSAGAGERVTTHERQRRRKR